MSEDADRKRRRGHDHVDEHLRRERRSEEALAREWGHNVVAKLDRRVLRDVLYDRKQRSLDRIFGTRRTSDPKIRVLVNLRGTRRDPAEFPPARDLREQREILRDLETSGRFAVARLEEHAQDEGVEVERSFWLTGSVLVTLTVDQLERFAAREDVASVANDKLTFAIALDTSRPLIGADQVASTLGFDGTGITVAVIDTGVDAAHPALTGVVLPQIDVAGDGPGDGFGHGTHCAGIVASQDRTFRGIAPGARVLDIKVMNNSGAMTPANGVTAITTAVSSGVQVASCSWGFTHADGAWSDPPTPEAADDSCVLCTAVNNAVAAGVVFCIAAGNEDNDSCSTYDTHIRCPGNARSAITVGASDDSDQMAGFSSVGPTPQGRQKPDLVAPGVQIASCRASGTSLGSPIDANFTNLDGTSMACPHVAGVAALMLNKTATLSPPNVMSIMTTTTVNIGASAVEMGAGRVDALAAVNAS
jgi:serine protease AprX